MQEKVPMLCGVRRVPIPRDRIGYLLSGGLCVAENRTVSGGVLLFIDFRDITTNERYTVTQWK